ncbi:MAG TPA: thrombospondin type 3 repeat-containing protein [Candidatus Paceibacterota bacterium]|nr:thrombospondin type 3 repeat-containing protein [Candidatus Paceibacterota bacterium]
MNTPDSKKDTINIDKNISAIIRPWEKYLPSKRIRIVVGIIILIAILYALKNPILQLKDLVFNRISVRPDLELVQSTVNQRQVPLSVDKDTDGDGLADWQESLLGTDPNIINTLEQVPETLRQVLKDSEKLVTTDDKLTLKIYQRLQTDVQGTNINEAVQAATTKELLDLADSMDNQVPEYTIDDIEFSEDNSISDYRSKIQRAQKVIILSDASIKTIYESLFSGKRSIELGVFQNSLNETISSVKAIPVPIEFIENHILLLNNMRKMSSALSRTTDRAVEESTRIALFLVFQKNYNSLLNTYSAMEKMLATN